MWERCLGNLTSTDRHHQFVRDFLTNDALARAMYTTLLRSPVPPIVPKTTLKISSPLLCQIRQCVYFDHHSPQNRLPTLAKT
jgi:hypothetical protein